MIIIKQKKAFSFIELIISMAIIATLTLVAYAPYNYYSNKAKVKATSKEISQILYESRNLAIHGLDKWSWNLSVWVYFDNTEADKNTIQIFVFPFSYTWVQIKPDLSDVNILIHKSYKFLPGVQIDSVGWKNNWLFLFTAIKWEWNYFYYDPSQNTFLLDEIDITFSYKWSIALKSKVNYLTRTNISDY